MPRGAKTDREETARRRAAAKRGPGQPPSVALYHRESFISLDGHEYLKGEDWRGRKQEVYFRDDGTCQDCGRNVVSEDAQIHHVQKRSQGGCDCLHNLKTLCGNGCHCGPVGRHV